MARDRNGALLAGRSFTALAGLAFGLLATVAEAQLTLPVDVPATTLSAPGSTRTYTIDLDSLPARPRMVVDVQVVTGDPGATLEIELTNFTGLTSSAFPFAIGCPLSFNPTGGWLSDPGVGSAHLDADLFFCHPGLTTWDGEEATVIVRAVSLGSTGLPVDVSVSIDGITLVPTDTVHLQVMGQRSVEAVASQDTVIYADDTDANNGRGQYLWSGTLIQPFLPAPGVYLRYPRRSLVKFSAIRNLLPSNANVLDAELELFATSINGPTPSVDLFAVAPGDSWFEGSADAAGIEFYGATSTSSSDVDWVQRSFSSSWLTAGGDTTTGTPLVSMPVTTVGSHSFSSASLASAVQDMVDADDFFNGFLLRSPPTGTISNGVQFGSSENAESSFHPRIMVEFDQPEPFGEATVDPDLVDFLDEGEDFRWVYDLDDDGVYTTAIGGVCETVPPDQTSVYMTLPASYSYAGAPGYVGVDCCTFQIFSAESQVTGSGQVITYHNLDPLNPANIPIDSDGDGIYDLCDNCPLVANGPDLGICLNGTMPGVLCDSDADCAAGETCDKGQLDSNLDLMGNACPEPGFGVGIGLGALGLGLLRRRPTQRFSGASLPSRA